MAVNIVIGTNSYISVDEADTYFNERLFSSSWNSSEIDDKARALIMACKNIEKLFYKGQKKEQGQKLSFPRCYIQALQNELLYNLTTKINSTWYCEEDVSQAIKDAQCEEAITLIERGNSKRRKLQQEGVQSFSLEGVSETFSPGAGKGLVSQNAKELLKPYLAGVVSIC